MRLYEGLFLTDSNQASKDWLGLEKHIQDILGKQGAEILHTEKWPERRLAFEIKGCKKGTYYLVYFNAPPESIPEMRRDVQLSERILRVLFISETGIEEEMAQRKAKQLATPAAPEAAPREERPAATAESRPEPESVSSEAPVASSTGAATAVAVEEPPASEPEVKPEGE